MKATLYTILFLLSVSCFSQSYDLDKRLLKEDDIDKLCDRVLYLKRNEIYARNCYNFSDSTLQDYFSYQPWYNPVDDNKEMDLNEIEQKNIILIKRIEDRRLAKYTAIKNYFLRLKQATASQDKAYIKKVFGNMEMEHEQHAIRTLAPLMSKIEPDNINYYKNKGLYETRIDNGFVIQIYSLEIEGNKIVLSYNYSAHSEIIEGFDECTTYMSEDECSYMWNFNIDEQNNITYQYLNIAG